MPSVERGAARISYAKAGAGPAVLLIQGVGLEGRAWRPQVEALTSRFTTITFDNRGIGASSYPRGPLTIEDMAGDALAVMDNEGIKRFHVVGHSMGGVVGQELALAAPTRVLSLSLLCSFARGRDAVKLDPGMLWTGVRTRIGTRRGRRNAFLEMVVPTDRHSRGETDAFLSLLTDLFGRDLADQPEIAMPQLKALSRYDAHSRLPSLEGIPALVVSAELDRIARPASGRALAAAIPGARYVELPGAGHAIPAYRPETVNDVLTQHLTAADASLSGAAS